MQRSIKISLALLLLLQYVQCDRPTLRQTANGPVEGIEFTIPFNSTKVYAFLSIPYAKPPITGKDPYTGELVDRRFKVRL